MPRQRCCRLFPRRSAPLPLIPDPFCSTAIDAANLHDCQPLGCFEMVRRSHNHDKGEVRMRCKDSSCPRSIVAEVKGEVVMKRDPNGRKSKKKGITDEQTKHLKTCKAVRESELSVSKAQRDLILKDLYFTCLGPKKYAEACMTSE